MNGKAKMKKSINPECIHEQEPAYYQNCTIRKWPSERIVNKMEKLPLITASSIPQKPMEIKGSCALDFAGALMSPGCIIQVAGTKVLLYHIPNSVCV